MEQKRIVEMTADGSHTLFVPEMDEHYHSVNGAVQESMHVFIRSGLRHLSKKSIRVLEIGFGTGLNALLTLAEVLKDEELEVEYYSVEAYPLPAEVVEQLNYGVQLKEVPVRYFNQLHLVPWDEPAGIVPGFTLYKMKGDANVLSLPAGIDLVYFDAFAPEKQPEMWNPELFGKIYQQMNAGGVLTTYCAKGMTRRMMQSAGLVMERLPGPPGKREMLRGTKIPEVKE